MTANQFRKLALALPEAVESAHNGHPDFRVGGKVFASLGPDEDWAMVKLSPAGQEACVREAPDAFEPFNGAWGRAGCTKVHLAEADRTMVRDALHEAWANTVPKRLRG
jgi:hypothetical protein